LLLHLTIFILNFEFFSVFTHGKLQATKAKIRCFFVERWNAMGFDLWKINSGLMGGEVG
jgi:hypothetical protein